MNAVNVVQLFILVWSFTAVCQADKDISVSCDDVTGSVGKEMNLTCRVSLKISECCIKMYKFQYPENYNHSAICRQDVSVNPCKRRNSFTCLFTPTTAMTKQFRFFVQTNCGVKKEDILTVEASEHVNPENPSGFKNNMITAVVLGFIIIIFIIMMAIICKTKLNFTKFCRRVRHDEDNRREIEIL